MPNDILDAHPIISFVIFLFDVCMHLFPGGIGRQSLLEIRICLIVVSFHVDFAASLDNSWIGSFEWLQERILVLALLLDDSGDADEVLA